MATRGVDVQLGGHARTLRASDAIYPPWKLFLTACFAQLHWTHIARQVALAKCELEWLIFRCLLGFFRKAASILLPSDLARDKASASVHHS